MSARSSKPRKEKKSEMLDVRLPYGLKQSLVRACKRQGVTVSDTVRRLISEYVDAAEASDSQPAIKEIAMKIARNPIKSLAMTTATASAFVLFAAQPSMAEDDIFASFDKNADGVLTEGELNWEILDLLDADDDQAVALSEFKWKAWSESTTDKVLAAGDGEPVREIAYIRYQVVFDGPKSVTSNRSVCSDTLALDASATDAAILLDSLKADCEAHVLNAD
ncbi:MAG: hypothetical protein AAFS13_07000 [Pseudomonadota bacterium]